MKAWFKRQWIRVKRWWAGVLVFLGLAVAPIIVAITQDFTYSLPTTYTDGTPLPVAEIAETRLYCNGQLVGSDSDNDGSLTVDLPPGTHTCYATVITTNGQESAPSNSVTRTVLTDAAPNPPTLNP